MISAVLLLAKYSVFEMLWLRSDIQQTNAFVFYQYYRHWGLKKLMDIGVQQCFLAVSVLQCFIIGTLLLFTLEKRSNDESHPDYIPSVFPTKKTSQLTNSKKIDRYNSVKRRASSNLANSSKIVMLTNISDQPSVSDVKPEPVSHKIRYDTVLIK